jgi:hypothetical protein
MELDIYGNPTGTVYREDVCPPELVCVPKETLHDMLSSADMEYNEDTAMIEPMGDAEAIIDFTKDLLFLEPITILNMAIPLTIFAVYGLTLYAAVKYIQKRFR